MPTETQVDKEQELRTELAKVEKIASIVIRDQETYDSAANALLAVKSWRKSWKWYWYGNEDAPGPITLANRSWKSLLAKFGERDDPAEKLEKNLGQQILKWDNEQRRLQEERQREAQRKAEEAAEAERARQAFEMEEAGASDEEIESLIEAPVTVVAEPVAPTYERAKGISPRANWCVQIADLKALLKAIGAGKFKLSPEDSDKLKTFMESLLKPQAVANKTTLNIPGCTAVNRPTISGRV